MHREWVVSSSRWMTLPDKFDDGLWILLFRKLIK
jgi:hypothetical protein